MEEEQYKSIKTRLLDFINAKGLSKSEFERLCGLSNGYLNSTRGNIGTKKLDCILRAFPELNRDWLLSGRGPMMLDSAVAGESSGVVSADTSPLDQDAMKDTPQMTIAATMMAVQEVSEMRKLLENTLAASNHQINKLIDINAEQSESLVRIADKLAERL